MLNLLAEVVPTAIEPGVWEMIQQNIAIVVTAITGIFASVGGTWLILKGGLKGIGTLLVKKKAEGDATKVTVMEKLENQKTLVIRKGQLEVNKKMSETEIMNLEIKLDVIKTEETREKIQNRIAMETAELAGYIKELEEIDKQIPSFSKFLS